jgi:hypothetical protein
VWSVAMLSIEEAIIEKLRGGPCSFDEVVTGLSNFSWGDVFVAVDCMSRAGRVCLSPTPLLDLSDLPRLAAHRIQLSDECEGDAIKAERVDCWERPRRGRDDVG